MKNKLQIFSIKHWGQGMIGSGTSLVVATCENYAREMLWQHFLNKQDRGEPLQVGAKSLMEVEPFEDSHLSCYPVSLDKAGVRIEYQFSEIDGQTVTNVVYVDVGATSLADELDSLQARENDGRGVSCVRSIVDYLRRDDLSAARAIVNNEGDKIASYPAIEAVLMRVGFVYQADWV
ncbi:MAG: hypothetical protein P4L53_23595 [Candidatus Obscuribacterales bacterium]|nr:hypothetical protein [Candidatus Obscuribacterales bacterium]